MRFALLILSTAALSAAAQTLPETVMQRMLPTYAVKEQFLGANPATMYYVDSSSVSTASIEALSDRADHAVYPQEGTGRRSVTLRAASYMHLDQAQTVRGGAGFSTGRIADVKWSNSVDYHPVGPYVLGDDTGGDLDFRVYDFSGGYSRRLTPRLSIGGDISYRAEMAWRDVDPRIKTIVSDLNATLGIAFSTSSRRLVSADASIMKYSQNCDLDFFNPVNEINTLPLTGLGTYNKRFAGNTNKNSGHSGLGYSASLRWASTDASGLQLEARWAAVHVDLMLRNFNNITLAYTDTYTTSASVAYGFNIGASVKSTAILDGSYQRRPGTENIFGTAAGASYDKIGSRTPYMHETTRISLQIPTEIHIGRGCLSVAPGAGYGRDDESLSSAARRIKYDTLWQTLSLAYTSASSGNWLWHAGGSYSHKSSPTASCSLTDPVNALQTSVVDTYKMLTAVSDIYSIEAQLDRRVVRVMAGVSARYTCISYSGHGTRNDINISIQVIF